MKFIIDHDLHIHSQLSLCSGIPEQTPKAILEYAKRLQELSVNYELHIYPTGRHGLGLADKDDRLLPHVQSWSELLTKFLELHKFI